MGTIMKDVPAWHVKNKEDEQKQPAQGSITEMKVSMKKGIGFYVRAAIAFLKGIEARETDGDKPATEAKTSVDDLRISGLGEAINCAITVAVRMERDGLATIAKIETNYPDMTSGRGCAQ